MRLIGGHRGVLSQKEPTGNLGLPALVHGTAYSVTSAGLFGTRSNYNFGGYQWNSQTHMHLCWALMDQGFPSTYTDAGWQAALGGLTAYWNNSTQLVTCPAFASTVTSADNHTGFGLVSGGPSQSGYYFQRGMGRSTMPSPRYCGGLAVSTNGIAGSSYNGEFYSFKYQASALDTVQSNVIAWQRTFYYSGSPPPYTCQLGAIPWSNGGTPNFNPSGPPGNSGGTWVGPWADPPLTSSNSSALYYSTNGVIGNVLPTLTNWHRYSTWVNYQVGVSTYGTYSTYVDGVPLYGSNSGITAAGGTPLVAIPGIDGSVTPSMSGTWAAPTVVSGSVNNGGMVLGAEAATYDTSSIYYTHNFADIYYDYTPARIEVTDGINVEIMCLTSWSSSAINYLFNKGALTTGAKRVLNVYNSSNVLVYSTYVAVA